MRVLQVADVLSNSASQGGAGLLDAAGARLSSAGERLQRAANSLPLRWAPWRSSTLCQHPHRSQRLCAPLQQRRLASAVCRALVAAPVTAALPLSGRGARSWTPQGSGACAAGAPPSDDIQVACCSDGDGREADAASAQGLRDDDSDVGMAAGARVSLDRVERHRLPAALLAALLAG
jgi:hypothetical protein